LTSLSFVIPCYRSEKTIACVVDEIKATVSQRRGYEYEIILVNDCSPDSVYAVIKQLCAADSRVKGVNLAKNAGQHAAILAGISVASGELVVVLEDDGQCPANETWKLIDKLDHDFDIVFARYPDKHHSVFRNLGSRINDMMAESLVGKPKYLAATGFIAMRRFVAEQVLKYKNPYPYLSGLLFQISSKIANVDVTHRDRLFDSSGYTFKKLIALWLNGFISFSVKPLRIATLLGIVCASLGFGLGVYIIISKIMNPGIAAGYSGIMATISFIGGMILLVLGMVGEYVGRIFICINNIPQFVVRDRLNVRDETPEKR
jgi:glycosyltransferase involved in cell wall biosynthesis